MDLISIIIGAIAGFLLGSLSGIAYACRRVREGAEPTLSSVVNRDGGKGEEGGP